MPVAIVGEMDIFYELNFCSSTTFPSASVARQCMMLRAVEEMQMPHFVSFPEFIFAHFHAIVIQRTGNGVALQMLQQGGRCARLKPVVAGVVFVKSP